MFKDYLHIELKSEILNEPVTSVEGEFLSIICLTEYHKIDPYWKDGNRIETRTQMPMSLMRIPPQN